VVVFVSEAGGIVATRIGVVGCESAGEDPLDDGVQDGVTHPRNIFGRAVLIAMLNSVNDCVL